jgi:hypothetical protein
MKTWSTYIILAAFILAGCSDEIPDNPVVPPVLPDEDGTVALTIRFSNSGDPSTYAIGAEDENKIDNLYVLAFTSGGGTLLEDKFAYYVAATSITDSTTDKRIQKAKAKLKNMVERQRLVLVANLPSGIISDLSTIAVGTKVSDVVKTLKFNRSDWIPGNDKTSFPMFGHRTDSMQFHSTANPKTEKLEFNMIRSVAKVDVGVDMYGTGDPSLGFGSIFKITSVYVYNASENGYIAPHNKYIESGTPPYNINLIDTIIKEVNLIPSDAQRASFSVNFNGLATGEGGRKNKLENLIYIPESDTVSWDKTTYTPAFLVVEATYYDATYFYRIDFTEGDNYVPVLRNHNYVFNITGIRAPGYLTLDSAIIAPVSRFGALELKQTNDIGLKEVISYNNEYYLAFNSTHLDVSPDGAQRVKIDVKSSYKNGFWEVSDQSWSAGSGNTGLYRTHSDPNSQAGRLDSIEFVIGINNTGLPRDFTFNVKAGMLTQKITITQSPGSNSYIGKPGVETMIPLSSANAGGVNRVQPNQGNTENYSVSILWKTSTLSLSISNVTDVVYITPTGTGNGVLVMKNPAGKILYSWHIWVPSNNLNDSTIHKSNNGFIFMDRNLGATSPTDYGLYYQWGRKDPFTPGAFGIDTIDSYTNNIELAIQHPDTFYAVPYTNPFDWAGTGANNSMWSTMDGKKGPYDPCPFGWRVPVVTNEGSGSPWYNFSGTTVNGVTYPSAGYIDAFSGVRSDAGVSGGGEGGAWGATAKGQQAYIYKFNTGTTSLFRANGYPVRCVKDTR